MFGWACERTRWRLSNIIVFLMMIFDGWFLVYILWWIYRGISFYRYCRQAHGRSAVLFIARWIYIDISFYRYCRQAHGRSAVLFDFMMDL